MNIVQGAKSVLHPHSMYDNKKQEVKTGLAPLVHCTDNYQKLKIFDFRLILPVPQAKSAMIFKIENLSEP